MIERDATIVNQLGLHARPAAKIVKLASGFAADIEIVKDGKPEVWMVERGTPNTLLRRGLTRDSLTVGTETSCSTSFERASRPFVADRITNDSAIHKSATMMTVMTSASVALRANSMTPATRHMTPRMPGAPKPGMCISTSTSTHSTPRRRAARAASHMPAVAVVVMPTTPAP